MSLRRHTNPNRIPILNTSWLVLPWVAALDAALMVKLWLRYRWWRLVDQDSASTHYLSIQKGWLKYITIGSELLWCAHNGWVKPSRVMVTKRVVWHGSWESVKCGSRTIKKVVCTWVQSGERVNYHAVLWRNIPSPKLLIHRGSPEFYGFIGWTSQLTWAMLLVDTPTFTNIVLVNVTKYSKYI